MEGVREGQREMQSNAWQHVVGTGKQERVSEETRMGGSTKSSIVICTYTHKFTHMHACTQHTHTH